MEGKMEGCVGSTNSCVRDILHSQALNKLQPFTKPQIPLGKGNTRCDEMREDGVFVPSPDKIMRCILYQVL